LKQRVQRDRGRQTIVQIEQDARLVAAGVLLNCKSGAVRR
jgi:hypothetical protein